MISGLKTTAHKVFVWRIYRICFTKSSPSPPSPMSRHRRWWNGTWDDEGATVSPANSPKCRRCCGYLCKKNAVLSNMDRRDFIELWVKTNEQMIAKVMTQQEHGRFFHGKYGEQLVPRISVFSCFRNKGGRDNNKPLHGYMYICGIQMVCVDIFIANKWMIINATHDHNMWCYHSLTFLTKTPNLHYQKEAMESPCDSFTLL